MTKPDNHIDTRLAAFDERGDLAGDIMALLDDLKLDKAVCETITLRAVSFISRRDHRVWNAAIQVGRADSVQKARLEWLDKQIQHVLSEIYPDDVFTKPTDADYKKANDFDANLHTRLHCDGIRHGLHILRREVRGLSGRDELAELTSSKEETALTAQEPTQEGGTDERS